MREQHRKTKLWARRLGMALIVAALSVAGYATITQAWHAYYVIKQPEYTAQYGRWDEVPIPRDMKVNAIHQALLPTGKVLLIAGSGNKQQMFDAGTFKTLLYNPDDGKTKLITTPKDMFCAGHAFLPNGNLLVAGGTQNYQIQPPDRTNTGGIVTMFNESPDQDRTLKKGTKLTAADGKTYITDMDIDVPRANKTANGAVTPTQRNVWVDATDQSDKATYKDQTLHVDGLSGDDANNFHGFSSLLDSTTKKDYEGARHAYEFNPFKEQYEETQPMIYARWYPTLTSMTDGHVMAISGLDAAGKILDGQTEIYDPSTKTWGERSDLQRFFPTYPSVFQTDTRNVLFSAGPSTGWGAADQGREPGFWNLADNTFTTVPGLRDPGILETGTATWYGFANQQKVVVVGGGGIGDSKDNTSRIDMVDLKQESPRFTPVANLEDGTRYPNVVVLPNGELFITGGSKFYRGMNNSNILKSYLLNPSTGKLSRMADPLIGRNYHSTALLLPNGQVLVAGSDPLFADTENTKPGDFEQRIEIYSPPYLFNKDGSKVNAPEFKKSNDTSVNPSMVSRGGSYTFAVQATNKITGMRLAHPGAVTHVTDTNARVIDLAFKPVDGIGVTVTIPENPSLTPPGYYLLYAVDERGHVSKAYWLHLDGQAGDTAAMAHDMPMMNMNPTVESSAPTTAPAHDMSHMHM